MSYSNMGIGVGSVTEADYGDHTGWGSRKEFENLNDGRAAAQYNMQQGVTTANQGAAGLQRVAANGSNYATDGYLLARQGEGQGNLATTRQNYAIDDMVREASMQGPSAAQAQMQQGLAQTQAAMGGMAAQARGGNQAAAMRNAQAAGSQMAMDTNQQAAVIRAQEQVAQRQQVIQAQGAAAQMYADRAQQGYSMQLAGNQQQLAGYGLQGQAYGQAAQVGLGVGGIGADAYGISQSAMSNANTAQLSIDQQRNLEESRQRNAMIGSFVNSVGAVAGSAAGK